MQHSDCKKCKDLLFDFVSELTDDRKTKWIKDHLAHCSACRQEYEKITQMLHVLHHAAEPELPSGFQLQLHQKLVKAADDRRNKTSFVDLINDVVAGRWKTVAPALVCLALVIGVFGSGLYDDWKNADAVLVGEKSASAVTSTSTHNETTTSAAPVPETTTTTVPIVEKKTAPAVREEGRKPAQTATAPQKRTEQTQAPVVSAEPEMQKTELPVTEEASNADAGIAVASEPMDASYGLRVSGGGSSSTVSEEQSALSDADVQQAEVMSEDSEAAERENPTTADPAEEETAVTETVAMSSYRVSVNQSVIDYLVDCQKATGIDWSVKADSLDENRALLILSDSEWEIFSGYISSTGVVPQTVHAGDVGVAVIIQR